MSDDKFSKEELQLIATAAIASTTVSPDTTEEQWQRAVIRRAATIQRMRFLQESNVLMNVLDSVRIRAKINDVTYEESSKRYVVTYTPQFGDNPQKETIRTPRMDNHDGELLKQDIERLKGCVGTNNQVIIFKHNDMPTDEQMAEARKQGKNIPAAGYRQAVWFEFLS